MRRFPLVLLAALTACTSFKDAFTARRDMALIVIGREGSAHPDVDDFLFEEQTSSNRAKLSHA